MKIALIETKSTHINVYSKITIPRLGSVLLGTILRDRGYDVDVYIEDIQDVDINRALEADLIGISTLTSTAPRSYQIAAAARAANIPVVIGGTHATFEPQETLENADFVIRGEGEDAFVELLEALEGRGDFSRIAGLSYWNGSEPVHNPPRPFKANLDENPIPDYSLIKGWNKNNIHSIMTSRGCPFDCTFCSVPAMLGRGYRMHSLDRVIEELKFHDSKWVFFADDIFTANKGRTKQLLRRMIAEGVTPPWGAQVRTEAARDSELLGLMRDSGGKVVYVGFESINPQTLKLFSKRQTVENIVYSIRRFHDYGIKIHGMFVVGSDEDTVETIRETEQFAEKMGIDTIQMMILTPIPGSEDYKPFAQGKRPLLTRDWSLYDGHHAVHSPKLMSPYEVQTETFKAMRRFYSLRNAAKRLFRGDLHTAYLITRGNGLIREWYRDAANRAWVEGLHQELYREASALVGQPASRLRKIVIQDGLASVELFNRLELFLKGLGVKVERASSSLEGVIKEEQGGVKAKLVRSFCQFLTSLKGRVDCVIVPVARELENEAWVISELKTLSESLRQTIKDVPAVFYISLDSSPQLLERTLMRLGLAFTKDLERIRQACFQASLAGI